MSGGGPVRRIVAVSGSKGGVGASMITTNLGIFLAQIGKRVVIIDADMPGSGIHAWLGAPHPGPSMGDVADGKFDRIEDAVVETPVTGLYLLGKSSELLGETILTPERFDRLYSRIRNLEADFVLIDLPSGLNPTSVKMFALADLSISVTVGTPDSVEATYRFWCAAFLHSLLSDGEGSLAVTEILEEAGKRGARPVTPREIVERLFAGDEGGVDEAVELSSRFHPQLIVNQTRIKADELLGGAMVSAAIRWIGLSPRLLGSVGWDDNVWLALRRGLPLLIDFPRSRACKDLEQIVRKMLSQEYKDLFSPSKIPPPTEEQNLYELLEIYPGASEEEVRRALKQIREWYGADGLAGRAACSVEECDDYLRRAEEAHARLLDRSKRREYDRANFPEGFSASRERIDTERDSIAGTVAATRDSLPRVELTDDQLVDGEFLGKIRKLRNVELIDISNRAKISVTYLKAIEEERFCDLPAPVFIRGFVTEFARFLKIDPRRATRDFMAKYESAMEPRGK